MDYGHPLEFGTFVTPSAAQPEAPVALAQFAESVGYDLVTFQDHPYQPAFLDTWTLMSVVAARTERVHVAPNVINVAMRQPAVLGRSAASLDLLSNGRFDLGIGAGGFWDAIEAMGQPRLTPGQAVDALEEAIAIIRGVWDTDDRTPLRIPGTYHHVDGAKRGPRPQHRIPIWIGALKPRMLALTGRVGDGWLPSLPYVGGVTGLADGNARIDDAASDAGRDPREIRRLLNLGRLDGSAQDQAEQIAAMALEQGESTFIALGDDPREVQSFAEEVIPVVRELVARERGAVGVSTGSERSVAALARRRDRIDYDGVPEGLTAVEPGDFGYGDVRSTYMRGGAPGLVLQPATIEQAVEALAFVRLNPDVPFAVRSGGHGISGRSTNDGGIVIDLAGLSSIEVLDEDERRVRIGPGARWMDVARVLGEHGWALSSGDYGGVGVGGLATAGGIGWLAREHGLTIDHLVAARILLADGTIVRADATENPELFWAVRGAGANLGIVVEFEFVVDVVGDIGWAQLAFDATDVAGFLEGWGSVVENSPRDVTSFIIIGGGRPGQQRVANVMTVVDSDDPDTILERLQPFAQLGPLLEQSVQLMPYAQLMANASTEPHRGQGEPITRSGLIEHVTPEFAQVAAGLLERGDTYFFNLRSVGGAVADVADDATAYAHRSANFSVAAFGSNRDRLDAGWAGFGDAFTGLYLSFETSLDPERIGRAFPPAALARLRAIKAEVDPDNVFRDNFNVVEPQRVAP